jgi:transcription termination/antitermination protein NusG
MTGTNTTTMNDDEFRRVAEAALVRAAEMDVRRKRRDVVDQSWYIVRAVGKSDQAALDWLDRFEIESYYPKIIEMKRVPRKNLSAAQRKSAVEIRNPVSSPLFPRYIFARLGMARDGWREIFRTAGVVGMVCAGDIPVRISDELIASIRKREQSGAVPGKEKARVVFGIGDDLLVTDGPFASFHGVVEKGIDVALEELDPETRIKLALEIFGRSTPVELEVWQVQKI